MKYKFICYNNKIFIYQCYKLKFDIISFFLALIFRNDVFDEITSSIQLWKQRVSNDYTVFQLRMKSSKFYLSILRMITNHENLFNRMSNDLIFWYYFQRIVRNANYYDIFIFHALWHVFANAIDNEYFLIHFLFSIFICN